MSTQTKDQRPNAAIVPVEGPASASSYGLNNEQLPDRLQEALRRLVFQFSTESELSRTELAPPLRAKARGPQLNRGHAALRIRHQYLSLLTASIAARSFSTYA